MEVPVVKIYRGKDLLGHSFSVTFIVLLYYPLL